MAIFMKKIRKVFVLFICLLLGLDAFLSKEALVVTEAALEISAPSAILIEASTGKVIFEQGADDQRSPASVTKIMTVLLTMEAIEKKEASLEDIVIVSEYASSMGGSQVFLAQGEEQTLDTMLKCIMVSSGNDASVAVAEHIAGSEEAFVEQMNEKAFQLGMVNTHFEDCCGLTDSDDHYTCARDVAIMSRELIVHYPKVYDYTKIWMEDITHKTKQGESRFGLSSTNKLLKQYSYTTGLKTGSTSKAKYCISATAQKNGVDLIAVILGGDSSKIRFSEAQTLLTYGFGVTNVYSDAPDNHITSIMVKHGKQDTALVGPLTEFRYVDISGQKLGDITCETVMEKEVQAPVTVGREVGKIVYSLGGREIGSVPICCLEEIEKAGFLYSYRKTCANFLL